MIAPSTASAKGSEEAAEPDLRPGTRGALELLDHPAAQRMLQAPVPARLAYVAKDGTPRVVAMLFHWTGEDLVMTSWPDDPKVAALRARPAVAVTIDTNEPPYNVVSMRGVAETTIVEGLAPECLATFTRYMGAEQGRAWVEMMGRMTDRMARIAIRPTWVTVFDFETRFPSGMARRMGGSAA